MKTTVEISDPLLRRAQRVARERRTTLRALVEDGLRRVIDADGSGVDYVVPDTAVKGRGQSQWDALSPNERLEVMYGADRG